VRDLDKWIERPDPRFDQEEPLIEEEEEEMDRCLQCGQTDGPFMTVTFSGPGGMIIMEDNVCQPCARTYYCTVDDELLGDIWPPED